MGSITDQAMAVLMISLRVAPALTFAPPFTLLRVPAPIRVLLGVALAMWLVAGHPDQTWRSATMAQGFLINAAAELFLGFMLALALALAFAALLTVGRAIDIQAGFGLAGVIDPTTHAQSPLVGTLFAYAAAAVFFASGGAAELLAIWSQSVVQTPLGSAAVPDNIDLLAGYLSAVFVMAFGIGGLIIVVLFVLDLAIAFMSRTLPQMNVLLLGFQVKTLAVLVTLPIAISLATSSLLRLIRYALETTSRLAGNG
ncbi:flagellar biosynthetic protein FliR [Sphingosinicella sp.]|uniref:flagellar biosynthetic protein FliR n=1 Tax=Sphingosinicella sp. TaxID=1917971 RepID=UPI0040383BA2